MFAAVRERPAPGHPPPGRDRVEGEEMIKESTELRSLTPAQRQARKAFRQVEAEKAMTDHDRAQNAFQKNRERLKAERLARGAAELGQKAKGK